MYIVTATLFDKKNCGTELVSVNKFESIAKISAKSYAEYLSNNKDLVVKENKNTFTIFKKTKAIPVAVCQVLFVPEESESFENL